MLIVSLGPPLLASLSLVLVTYTWSLFEDLCLGLVFPCHRGEDFCGSPEALVLAGQLFRLLIAPRPAQRSEKLVVEISLDHTVESGL